MGKSSKIIEYQCVECDNKYSADPFIYTCKCGGNLNIRLDYSTIRNTWSKKQLSKSRDNSVWRYLPLLPVKQSPGTKSLMVGGTPLIQANSNSSSFPINKLYFKDDTRNPSGSLKDRASEIGVMHAKELGYDTLVTASTGNAAASLSAVAAYYRMKTIILVPAYTPRAKLTQILQYGAKLIPVDGTYDDAFRLSVQAAEYFGWYLRSTGVNPVMSEGKKTVALEIAEQLNWNIPDVVFIPVGDGCIIGSVFKGFSDLLQLGWINTIPRLVAVQAEGSAAIVNAVKGNGTIQKISARTVADSISVDYPKDGVKGVKSILDSKGFGITVTDEEILKGQTLLAENFGIFAEPAAAAAYSGFFKASEMGKLDSCKSVVLLITGSGLKDIEAANRNIQIPEPINSNLSDLVKRVETIK